MNAPAEAALAALNVELLPLDTIVPSDTHVQTLRRKRFSAAALLELAQSIREIGVLQPVVVRPTDAHGLARYELVAGERRWRAAQRAGLGHVPAVIRDLTEAQAVRAQLVENLQRETLHPLEEAQGYRDLLDLERISVDQLAEGLGKSPSTVRARLKLLDLCPEAQDALQAGTLDASRALALARIPGHKLQKKALQFALDPVRGRDGREQPKSFRHLVDDLRHKFMLRLDAAPFPLDQPLAAVLVKSTGLTVSGRDACTTCPHYTPNDPEIDAELDGAPHCLDRACYEHKTANHLAAQQHDAEANGDATITGAAAKRIVGWDGVFGYIVLDDQIDDMDPPQGLSDAEADDWEPPTWRAALGDFVPARTTLIEDARRGRFLACITLAQAKAAAKAAKLDVPAHYFQAPQRTLDIEDTGHKGETAAARDNRIAKARAEKAREEERAALEIAYREDLLRAIAAKWKPPLKLPDWFAIATELWEQGTTADIVNELFNPDTTLAKLQDDALQRFIVCYIAAQECEHSQGKPGRLLELAGRLKLDPRKIRAATVARLKPTSAAPDKRTDKPKKAK